MAALRASPLLPHGCIGPRAAHRPGPAPHKPSERFPATVRSMPHSSAPPMTPVLKSESADDTPVDPTAAGLARTGAGWPTARLAALACAHAGAAASIEAAAAAARVRGGRPAASGEDYKRSVGRHRLQARVIEELLGARRRAGP
jgi:hypothetical protein